MVGTQTHFYCSTCDPVRSYLFMSGIQLGDIRDVDRKTKGVQRVVVVERRSAKEDKGQKYRFKKFMACTEEEDRTHKKKGGPKVEIQQTSDIQRTQDHESIIDISTAEVGEPLKKIGGSRAVGPDHILIEVWRGLGEEGIHWLTNLFNVILKSRKMSEEWRVSTRISLFKNKGDAQVCRNYKGIQLLSHTMKSWKRVIEKRIRRDTVITENQFGFMPGRLTTEAYHTYLLRKLMEKYMERKKDLHLVFIDLEKAYDSIPRNIV
ncbi:uncharacterized protein LOC130821782 [Amaranthus tricolor]|uniref:uncharacterized protein LOC130821782 n=1 Tax=Amaranthus tricolor TaxID=29722 RepID=UPI002587CCA2|nr:uncharacterized protein LOC130821782 [Amaranthus tricolor]